MKPFYTLLYTTVFCIFLFPQTGLAQISDGSNQIEIDYKINQPYEIGGIEIKGVQYLDKSVLAIISGLFVGQKIKVPGDEISSAIENLWKQNLFENVKISVQKVEGEKIFLEIELEEKPKLNYFGIFGLKRSASKNLREDALGFLKQGIIINEHLLRKVRNEISSYYFKKGYMNTSVTIEQKMDTVRKNFGILNITVNKGPKIKVNDIIFTGNNTLASNVLRRQLKDTKKVNLNIFKSAKFIETDYQADKQHIIDKYLSLGYRDARIVSDTFYQYNKKRINVQINIEEGRKYYFRNINFTGNTKYRMTLLDSILSIKKGDVYNQGVLESHLNMNPGGYDVASLYMDDGYLFFNVQAVEVLVENDSIDLEIRMVEGPQAIINKIIIKGNTKTSEHVILRELRTRPGDKFSRTDITRSVRELSQLGYFDPEQLGVNPIPNPANGTVDIEYKVAEKASDQIELSGGYGGYGGVVGVLGLTLNNFSATKMLKRKEWTPLPGGDGQRLSIRAQSNGRFYQSYNFSFTEPWLGGKKPNSFTFNVFHSIQGAFGLNTPADASSLKTTGVIIALGRRLKKPDDYFVVQNQINWQRFNNNKYSFGAGTIILPSGVFNDFNIRTIISRSSSSDPIYPLRGSNLSLSIALTPPYSLFRKNNNLGMAEQLKFMEYHKWKFDAQWFNTLTGKLVLATRMNFGFMGAYNKNLDVPLFNRFLVGGSGLVGYSLDGREIISQRGYDNGTISRTNQGGISTIYNRFTMELRYPISLNPSATVYVLGFAEAGNAWERLREYNPFNLYRAAGVGIRVFLPMFGLLGFDVGKPFDAVPGASNWQTHFFLGQQF